MSSFEDRVRSDMEAAAAHYVPTDGLAGEVRRRVGRHRRARVVQAVVGVAGVVVFAAGLVVLLATDERGEQATTFAGTTSPGATLTTVPAAPPIPDSVPSTSPSDSVPLDDSVPVGDVGTCGFGGRYTRPATEPEAGPYLGLEESAALFRAASTDSSARVLCRDGRWLIGPGPGTLEDRYFDDGLVEDRLEFEVRDGVVVGVEVAVRDDG